MASKKATLQCFEPAPLLKPESVEEALRLQATATLRRADGNQLVGDGDQTGGDFALSESARPEWLRATLLAGPAN